MTACRGNCKQGRACTCCGGDCPTPQACELPEARHASPGVKALLVALFVAVIGAIVRTVT